MLAYTDIWSRGLLLFLLVCSQGCFALLLGPAALEDRIVRSHQKVVFLVLDAETTQPIPGATVTVGYAGWAGMVPGDVAGVTDTDGKVELRVVRDRAPGASVETSRYMPNPEGELGGRPPSQMVLRVFRLPRPYHVLEVPAGYRGILEFRIVPLGWDRDPPQEYPNWKPGQREFVTRLEPEQVATMQCLPEFGGQTYDFESILLARSADETPIPLWFPGGFRKPLEGRQDVVPQVLKEDTVALWHLGSAEAIVMYMGTLRDAESAQNQLRKRWEGSLREGLYWLPPMPQPTQ